MAALRRTGLLLIISTGGSKSHVNPGSSHPVDEAIHFWDLVIATVEKYGR